MPHDGWVDEVINSAGTIAGGPGAWTLIASQDGGKGRPTTYRQTPAPRR
ncbi:hypothetical protein AB0H57_09310 [Micromonospora sp. NPDC050686]